MAVYDVAAASDIPEGTHQVVSAGGRPVGVFNVHGRLYALPSICPHQGGPLCGGRVSGTLTSTAATGWRLEWVRDGEIVSCPWHGMEFDVLTGRCLADPRLRVRPYTVRVQGGRVIVDTANRRRPTRPGQGYAADGR